MTLQPLSETAGRDMARWVEVLAPARQLAEVIAQTDFVPKAMRGKPDVVTAAIMFGDELGLGPMQALQGIDVIEGRPRPSAEMMRALIFRAGHAITVHESTGTRCRVSGLRLGRPESERVSIDWTIDMAKAAGLLSKSNWRAYPRAMLLARATSDLARVLFPDVVKGLGYVAEDDASAETLEAWAVEQAPDDEKPKRRTVQRKTAPKHAAPPPMIEGPPVAPDEPPKHKGRVVDDVDLPAPPEKPAEDEPPPDGEQAMATPAQLNNLYAKLALFGPGKTMTQEQRRQVFADLVGVEHLDSASDLTREQAYAIRAVFMRVGAGLAYLDLDERTSKWRVVDVPQEEPAPEGGAWDDLGGGQP